MSNRKRTVLGLLLTAAAAVICGAIDTLLKADGHNAVPEIENHPFFDDEE